LRINWRNVPITEPADRLDGRAGLLDALAELAAQPHDAELHPVRPHPERVVPGQLQQLVRGEGLARMPDQRGQQAELGRGQRDRRAAHADLAGGEPDQQPAVVVDLGPRLPGPGPAEQRLHPGGQFTVAERGVMLISMIMKYF
jgi:hypothetical protein